MEASQARPKDPNSAGEMRIAHYGPVLIFFSTTQKDLLVFYIKVEKKFNTTRLSGALGGNVLQCYIGYWLTRIAAPVRRPMPGQPSSGGTTCAYPCRHLMGTIHEMPTYY